MGVSRSTDAGGESWTLLANQGVVATRVVETPAGVVAIGFGVDDVERTADGGTTIGRLPVDVRQVFGAHGDTIVGLGHEQVIVSMDGGATWVSQSSDIASAL